MAGECQYCGQQDGHLKACLLERFEDWRPRAQIAESRCRELHEALRGVAIRYDGATDWYVCGCCGATWKGCPETIDCHAKGCLAAKDSANGEKP